MSESDRKPRPLELLAPARDAETAIAAIDCGADAVYIGGPHHGARAAASNTIDDIRRVCDYAHQYRARVYVTLNTIVYDNELEAVRQTVCDLCTAGVDALIVQDMALFEMNIPPIALHASTQADARTPQRARFLEDAGASCIVLPREMSLDMIRDVRGATTVPLEAFVHGALCVSYSGDCRASLVNGGRSANRGECAQICRLKYELTDKEGNVLREAAHWLSLKDLNRIDRLGELADAGVSSFKIEGRLKGPEYVRNVTAAYSQALDTLCAARPAEYCRASVGRSLPGFTPAVDKSFNRGFTIFALDGTSAIRPGSLAAVRTPKWTGSPVAVVAARLTPRRLRVTASADIHNGDGLGFFDAAGHYSGFRVNRIEGDIIHLAADAPPTLKPGTKLMRNFDKAFDDALTAARSRRVIDVDMQLRATDKGLVLRLEDVRGCAVESAVDCELQPARTPQDQQHRRVLEKLGDTIYSLRSLNDACADVFVPASVLTSLRRRAVEMLTHAAHATRPIEVRRRMAENFSWPEGDELTFHANVANAVAAGFYMRHGVKHIEPALEVSDNKAEERRVMTSRYCLRRELGCCLKTPGAKKLPSPLYLRDPDGRVRTMRLDFDCTNCLMHVTATDAK